MLFFGINRDDWIAHTLPGDPIAGYRSAVGGLIEFHEAFMPGEAAITRPCVFCCVAGESIALDRKVADGSQHKTWVEAVDCNVFLGFVSRAGSLHGRAHKIGSREKRT